MIRASLSDSETGVGAKLQQETNSLYTWPILFPPENNLREIPYLEYFTDSSGSNDMRVDGSSESKVFSIKPDKDDLYIININILVADGGSPLNQFARIGELQNGISMTYNTTQAGKKKIIIPSRSNFEFIRHSNLKGAFGSGNNVFRFNNAVSGNSEAFVFVIDLRLMFNMAYGLVLKAGTVDSIDIEINDNLSNGITQFDATAQGKYIIK